MKWFKSFCRTLSLTYSRAQDQRVAHRAAELEHYQQRLAQQIEREYNAWLDRAELAGAPALRLTFEAGVVAGMQNVTAMYREMSHI